MLQWLSRVSKVSYTDKQFLSSSLGRWTVTLFPNP